LLREGAVLGVWRLRAALHGSEASQSGQWYSARHALAADRDCNVLVLPRCERSAGIMLRFGDQVSDLGALAHPVIKVPNDSGITPNGQPYLIFDATDGQPIVRACSALPLRERLQLVVELCEALRYAHQQGWLLGEIDPSLLWVGSDRKLKLMGMGLLRMPDPADPFERGLSLASAPGFASPETMAGEPPSFASEVYGLGVLLCLLVDGRVPSEQDADTLSPAASWPGLGALERFSLDALLRKAVAPQAARRYAGVEALAEDLRAWLAGEDHSALVLTPMPVTASSGAIAYESAVSTWPGPADAKRRSVWAGLALAAVTVLSAAAWQAHQAWPLLWSASAPTLSPAGRATASHAAAPLVATKTNERVAASQQQSAVEMSAKAAGIELAETMGAASAPLNGQWLASHLPAKAEPARAPQRLRIQPAEAKPMPDAASAATMSTQSDAGE
jgi:serine/threonine-protein kinase